MKHQENKIAEQSAHIDLLQTSIYKIITCEHDQPALELLEIERDALRKENTALKQQCILYIDFLIEQGFIVKP